jgi:Nitrogenase molybdenum-iron protein, alpha and beta chains
MAINLREVSVGTRENRLGSITGYSGSLGDLCERVSSGCVGNRERCFSQSSTCLSGCALGQLGGIRDVAIINHAPAGCTALAPGVFVLDSQLAAKRGVSTSTVFVGSDMDERDTIFGAVGQLREIALEVYSRYKPKAIFLGGSCVTGVIAEDLDTLATELSSELPVPVVAVNCEGFKSRIWASGFDASDHAVLSSIVKPPKAKRRVLNFKNFTESQRPWLIELFARFDLEPLFFYMNSTVEELSRLSESLATVCVCGTLGTYLGNALEERYGVPYVRTINPMGISGFEAWLREIGRIADRTEAVEAYIAEERAKYLPKIEELKKGLKGLRAVIGMGPGYTFEVARVLQELGMEVVWAAAWHFDPRYDNGAAPPALQHLRATSSSDIKLSVTDQQNYEVLNILNHYKPDIYFSRHPGTTVWAIKQGTAALYVADEYMILGYHGTLAFAQAVLDTVRNRSFERNLAARSKVPYTDFWYEQANDRFLEKENL